jgi:hypothetical protein
MGTQKVQETQTGVGWDVNVKRNDGLMRVKANGLYEWEDSEGNSYTFFRYGGHGGWSICELTSGFLIISEERLDDALKGLKVILESHDSILKEVIE